MRTTVNLDADVLDKARDTAQRLGRPFRSVVNEALRRGLQQIDTTAAARPYRTESRALGLRHGYSLDNVEELLSRLEGEEAR